ncbi:MAG: hypothetical protein WCD89_17630 [Anaerocolumna sp.]
MDKVFYDWIIKNRIIIEDKSIKIDEIVRGKGEYVEEATRVDFINDKKLSRVVVFQTGRIYIQILDINTEATDFFYDDYMNENENFDTFIWEAINKMI